MNIRQAKISDANAITEIYNWYVINTSITFETDPVSVEEMEMRIKEKLDKYDWFVAEKNDVLIGYAYYGPFRARVAYQHTIESTIYLSHEFIGNGMGVSLYGELINAAKNQPTNISRLICSFVPRTRFELARRNPALPPQSSVSTNFTTWAGSANIQ